jgi:hypothetical protein
MCKAVERPWNHRTRARSFIALSRRMPGIPRRGLNRPSCSESRQGRPLIVMSLSSPKIRPHWRQRRLGGIDLPQMASFAELQRQIIGIFRRFRSGDWTLNLPVVGSISGSVGLRRARFTPAASAAWRSASGPAPPAPCSRWHRPHTLSARRSHAGCRCRRPRQSRGRGVGRPTGSDTSH